MAYPIFKKEDPKLLEINTKNDISEDSIYKTQKHVYENILKSPRTDNEYYKENTNP